MRAIGIERVSNVRRKGRTTDESRERLQSMKVQRDKIERYCADRFRLLRIDSEPDTSGHAKLEDRKALGPAMEEIRDGRADVIVFAEQDRAFRSYEEQTAAGRLIEAAGGELHCTDLGRIVVENGSDDEWFTGGLHGLLSERQWRIIRRKSIEGTRKAIEGGRLPVRLAPWLRRTDDGGAELDERLAPIYRQAFKMRAEGATIKAIQAYLRRHRIERSYAAVDRMFGNRQAIGEASFRGKAHDEVFEVPALVSADLFRRVQAVAIPRGPQAKSDRLLARLGVLRCDSCGARMTVGGSLYNCPNADCTRRVSVTASLVESYVVEQVKLAIAGIRETAHSEVDLDAAKAEVERAEQAFAAAVEILDPTEAVEVKRLRALRETRDAARASYADARERLDATGLVVSVEDWDDLSREGQRDLIRAVVERVSVKPGRHPDRLSVELKVR
jgi:Resolvase, N terminal domain